MMVNQTTFYIQNVYHNERYGLYMGMYSLALQSAVQACFSFLQPYCIAAIGTLLFIFFVDVVVILYMFFSFLISYFPRWSDLRSSIPNSIRLEADLLHHATYCLCVLFPPLAPTIYRHPTHDLEYGH
jgi:hypothetical protein